MPGFVLVVHHVGAFAKSWNTERQQVNKDFIINVIISDAFYSFLKA